VVEPERFFVMGDNRDHSNDSRSWGTVRLAEIKGPAFVLYWSWDWDGSWRELLNPVTWWENLTRRMRWGRIGDRIGCVDLDSGPGVGEARTGR
jgi:signal peptidase I